MGESIIGRNLIDYEIENVSSQNANWPASNLLIFEKRIRYWKSTVITDTYIVIDMLAAKQLTAVALIDVNFASCKIQGNASDSWGAPSFDSNTLTIYKEKLTGLYRLIYTNLASFNYRYLRVFIPGQTPTDNASAFRMGVLAVTEDAEEFLYGINPDTGIHLVRNQAITVRDMHGGGQEKAANGVPYASLSFAINRLRNPQEFTQITDQLVSIGETELIMFTPGDMLIEEPNNGQYVFLMNKQSPPDIGIVQGQDQISVDLRESI